MRMQIFLTGKAAGARGRVAQMQMQRRGTPSLSRLRPCCDDVIDHGPCPLNIFSCAPPTARLGFGPRLPPLSRWAVSGPRSERRGCPLERRHKDKSQRGSMGRSGTTDRRLFFPCVSDPTQRPGIRKSQQLETLLRRNNSQHCDRDTSHDLSPGTIVASGAQAEAEAGRSAQDPSTEQGCRQALGS
ncbi:hypothetical protein L227DRAFT_357977 [Lentinus tigrinus ALCF2SS1-6]|uniref:Uncharacterized protein n=1 Tax=Lentinus tigrinus ALCF2SS1-6 TaxID=1328759 RepID=A0A5C2SIT3_9APHY|nr:hypothetical protein L227DRAFT_357977 [Lentinus tigrinus ALCF2SS1-6]